MRRRPQRVWFLVAPGTGVLDIAGPWEVLGHANDVLGRAAYDLQLVGPRAPAVRTRYGLVVAGVRPLPGPAAAFRRSPSWREVAAAPLPDGEARLVAWLRRNHRRIPSVISI